MRTPNRAIATLLLSLLAAPPVSVASANDDPAIVHALNRLGYGPRPGDVERVRAMGLDRWIDQQLHPERIADPEVRRRLAGLETHGLSTNELFEGYEVPREARREMQKKRAEMGDDASEADLRKARREMVAKYASDLRGSPRTVVTDLQEAKVLRAVYSERQLEEVLTDFWLNHFNVFANKGPDRFLLQEYESAVIRPHVLGRFEDLLQATAKSPAMLFYLDNWLSADPAAAERTQAARARRSRLGRGPFGRMGGRADQGQAQRQRMRRGLNENYAREIMELHTLGVDGGYTQKDVTEVARAFTGWTIRGLRDQDPRFAFDARVHDEGDKVVLGQKIRGGGQEEGERIIHILATHPSTARFVVTKLARRFVADEPPPALVDRGVETFRRTDGDLRAVVNTIVTSPEFAASRGEKVKTPLEFATSALRASNAEVTDARDVVRRLGEMGMPLYQQQAPTGYKDVAEAWVSTSGLLARMNFATDLAGGRVRGVRAGAGTVAASTLGAPEFQRR